VDAAGTTAPAVVAVVVARNPGAWFDDVLDGLATQDYPNLSVLVVDAASADGLTARIAERLPTAYVRRLNGNPGYGPAANEALRTVEGADFLLFLHDDVALDRHAVRHLVEEAFRSNAGIVGPKLVSWHDSRRLLAAGLSADRTGAPAPVVDRGELDQAQHDTVREVLAVPGACLLVRSDLFHALDGFDPGIALHGEDLDLCWRAGLAGARVVVQPAARARHVEALAERRPVDDRRRLQARHRLRSFLVCSSAPRLLLGLPAVALLTVAEALYGLAVGRPGQARDVLAAWTWNLRRLGEVRERRAALAAVRTAADGDLRRLQVRGSARLSAFLRGQFGPAGEDRIRSVATAGRELASSLREVDARLALVVWAGLLLVLVVGSRHLLTGAVPAVGDFAPFRDGPGALLDEWTSGWRHAGLGSAAPAPTAFGLLSLLGALVLGQMALLRTLVVVGLVVAGLAGAWRLTGAAGSLRGRLVGLVVYAAVPVAWNAVAEGRLPGLVAYAAAPWLLARLALGAGWAPWGPVHGRPGPGVRERPVEAHAVALGLVLALAAMLVPWMAVVVAVAALAMAAGSVVVGERPPLALAVVAGGGLVVAAVLHVPWSFDLLPPGGGWSAWPGLRPPGATVAGLGDLLRFETGPIGAAPLGWGFLVAAALPLAIGRGWRLAWAVRAWSVAIALVLLQWAAERGWLPVEGPDPEVGLAMAAAALAMAAALGVAAFETDLPGFRFGWRQVATGVAVVALLAGTVPFLGAAVGGRWDVPREGVTGLLSVLDGDPAAGAFRVLWLGDPDALPVAGWELDDGVAWGLSDSAVPPLQGQWSGSDDGATALVGDAVRAAAAGRTTRLGRLLAPFAVRYVVVPRRLAPVPVASPERPPPAAVGTVLSSQLDLQERRLNDAVLVFENVAWVPARAALEAGSLPAGGGLRAVAGSALPDADPALTGDGGFAEFAGDVPADRDVLWSAAYSDRWRLTVDGEGAEHRKVLGWANAWDAGPGGGAVLSYATPPLRVVLLVVQVLLWLAALQFLVVARRGRRPAPDPAAAAIPGAPPEDDDPAHEPVLQEAAT
jgi:GT2 family glycosyltransferase